MATDPGTQARGETPVCDATLVARARGGDLNAFETLVRRYQRPVYRLAVRMLADRGQAEDVTQDVFVATWRRLTTLRRNTAIRSWLYRVAANRCRNLLRARRPTEPFNETETLHRREHSPSAEEHAQAAQQLTALRAALNQLTPDQRACWLLAEIEMLPYAEIAEILQTSPAAVRGRLSRARAKLAEVMQPWQ